MYTPHTQDRHFGGKQDPKTDGLVGVIGAHLWPLPVCALCCFENQMEV
jgi:hypothetical protein